MLMCLSKSQDDSMLMNGIVRMPMCLSDGRTQDVRIPETNCLEDRTVIDWATSFPSAFSNTMVFDFGDAHWKFWILTWKKDVQSCRSKSHGGVHDCTKVRALLHGA